MDTKYFKHISPGVWELTGTHLLYNNKEGAEAYSAVKKNIDYCSFHAETIRLCKMASGEICESAPFTLVELGPEFPDKTIWFANAAKDFGEPLDYAPVDIHADWAILARNVMANKVRRACEVVSLFEDCASKISENLYPRRMVFIGLSFMNYSPHRIWQIMREVAGPDGSIGIAQELITDINTIPIILHHYQNSEFQRFAFGPLTGLGVDIDEVTFDVRFERGRVEGGCIFKRDYPALDIQAQDRLITVISYRRTKEDLEGFIEENSSSHRLWVGPNGSTALVIAKL